jgi:hypothetical protein
MTYHLVLKSKAYIDELVTVEAETLEQATELAKTRKMKVLKRTFDIADYPVRILEATDYDIVSADDIEVVYSLGSRSSIEANVYMAGAYLGKVSLTADGKGGLVVLSRATAAEEKAILQWYIVHVERMIELIEPSVPPANMKTWQQFRKRYAAEVEQ